MFALNHALAAYATTITCAVSDDISYVKAHRAKSCPLHHAVLESCVCFLTLAAKIKNLLFTFILKKVT